MKTTIGIPVFVCFVFCAGKSTRVPSGAEPGLAIVRANVQTFPEGADKALPQVKKFTHEDITVFAWSKDFARGNATLIEIESSRSLDGIRLDINGRERKLLKGRGCLFVLHANSADSKLTANKLTVYRGKDVAAEFELPVVKKEYPVAHSKMTVNNFSNQSKPMSEKTLQWIEEGRKKKMQAFISAQENFLTSDLRYPRDEHKITSPFFIKRIYERFKLVRGKKKKLAGKTSFHGGTDLKGPTGAPIFAIADGVVNLAEQLYYDGNIVMIDHGNGIISGYMHQSELLVKAGERVKAGQLIGKTGATGMVTGPHLHIFLHINGVKVDPLSLLHLPLRPAH
ncbi:MAG: M23 family metallopeptidase [Turneriella sp.]